MSGAPLHVVVFTGPTISEDEAAGLLPAGVDADIRPPAAHGDVLRAALERPDAIGLIDGVFDRLPAVWHKELLWAISEGIRVYGAGSMGALRAAELAPYGMRAVGRIAADYLDGTIEDDDEVAVQHADTEHGFRTMSDAMVDIRATLNAATEAGVLGDRRASQLADACKATFYANRRLRDVLDADVDDRLLEWLSDSWVAQKRLDAIELLTAISRDLGNDDLTDHLRDGSWTLQRTQYFEDLLSRVHSEHTQEPDNGPGIQATAERDRIAQILDESRLLAQEHREIEDRALLAILARSATGQSEVRSPERDHSAVHEMFAALGLTRQDDLDQWLVRSGLERTDLDWLSQRWADRRWVRRANGRALPGALIAELRASGRFEQLVERAERKRRGLTATAGSTPPTDELVSWYFDRVIDRPQPPNLDGWARFHGWRDQRDLIRAIGHEWRYRNSER